MAKKKATVENVGESITPGLYAEALTDEELELLPHAVIGSVEEEIKMTKIRLRRAYIAENNNEALQILADSGEEGSAEALRKLNRVQSFSRKRKFIFGREVECVESFERKVKDYGLVIDKLINQLANLERLHFSLTDSGDMSAEEKAKRAREAMEIAGLAVVAYNAIEQESNKK